MSKKELENDYGSPRWSKEILDCSMPMTFDTYSACAYNCLYCFSFYQKSHSMGKGGCKKGKQEYQVGDVRSVSIPRVKKIFSAGYKGQFIEYVRDRKVMQWGGLADQFDEYERRYGVTLELLKFFKDIDYPLSFSTKGVWWLKDKRYLDLFRGQRNWNCKFSIINLDPNKAKRMEGGVVSPEKRLDAIKRFTDLGAGGATLRLRPFIIGHSDRGDEYLRLIERAYKAGATAVSTEFFCLESRADQRLKYRYKQMSDIIGFDVWRFYRRNTPGGSGYLRLGRLVKEPYVKKMHALCKKLGMRFYVSDAHFKEYCDNGSCCGLPESWNYSRGQFTEALVIARKKGSVRFRDIAEDVSKLHSKYSWGNAQGFNTNSCEARCVYGRMKMSEFIRLNWNEPNRASSPYKYFGGVLRPDGLDEDKNVIYKYVGDKLDAGSKR